MTRRRLSAAIKPQATLSLYLLFALFMGFWGGLLPSIRAARLPIATALREL